MARENNPLKRKTTLVLPGTPIPGSHKGISRLIESEYDSVSRSGKYVRSLGSRCNVGTAKKLSPLVSNKEIHEKSFLNRASKGLFHIFVPL